jgi:hypothetical protein
MTLEAKMKEAAYKTSGFDYLRLTSATSVICRNSVNVSYGLSATFDLFRSDWRQDLWGR